MVSYSDEPCLEMVIFCTYLQCWSEIFLLWMGEGLGKERSEHAPRVLYETLKIWKLLRGATCKDRAKLEIEPKIKTFETFVRIKPLTSLIERHNKFSSKLKIVILGRVHFERKTEKKAKFEKSVKYF